ncbi:MAG: GNAT family N-acetyltransferase [Acidobacteria bacterium]|nr:GNAT family N-acetyltransferase [Acidobacteriota bacterium]
MTESDFGNIAIRPAVEEDFDFVVELMDSALSPYYGGDHRAHAERIFKTHISGGVDQLGFFSREQKMFVATVNNQPAGMIHVVGKRQCTYKISPLIVAETYRNTRGLGTLLLDHAEKYARDAKARQIYCTVAENNSSALGFFRAKGYIPAGKSASHYKTNITEVMLYKHFVDSDFESRFDRVNISVVPLGPSHEKQVRDLLLENLPPFFDGIDDDWVNSLFGGYERRDSQDINLKYKLIYVAVNRDNTVLGVAGATPKKGEPIKVMPFLATTLPAFVALLSDIPFLLKDFGRKLYIHIAPTSSETLALQQRGWNLDAVLPEAYHLGIVTEQWSSDLDNPNFMRQMRIKKTFLDLIRKGEKTLEVRVGYNNIRSITDGELIRLTTFHENQVIKVNQVRKYDSFAAMMEEEDFDRIAPGRSEEDVFSLLKDIYPPEKESLGVIVLDISPQRI